MQNAILKLCCLSIIIYKSTWCRACRSAMVGYQCSITMLCWVTVLMLIHKAVSLFQPSRGSTRGSRGIAVPGKPVAFSSCCAAASSSGSTSYESAEDDENSTLGSCPRAPPAKIFRDAHTQTPVMKPPQVQTRGTQVAPVTASARSQTEVVDLNRVSHPFGMLPRVRAGGMCARWQPTLVVFPTAS